MIPRDVALDAVLRSARVPVRSPEYWEEFPARVIRRLRNPVPHPMPLVRRRSRWRWSFGLATACVVAAFLISFWRERESGFTAAELAQSRKIYQELAALFPDRLQAVQFDEQGAQLVLATDGRPPASAPLLVQICHAGSCRRFITYSGQRVALNGENFEILADARGNVLVVGDRLAWSSSRPRQTATGYRIRAAALAEAL